MKKISALILPAVLLMLCSMPLWAVEGMWTLDNLPRAALKKEHGFAPDAAWVDKVMKASVRVGGCSGSFVSANGLVMTNHHCVNGCVQNLSTAGKDYVKDGFLAAQPGDEKICPGMEANRLEQITDVTARMNQATAKLTGAQYSKAQKAEKSRIEAECSGENNPTTRCDVVELYQGGRYNLYRYRRFPEVRLVFAPEKTIAFFGGDPDNFNFPRYNLDLGLLRVYDQGAPAKIADYFRFNAAGPAEGELTFITGHPGSTDRQLTVSQLERMRDLDLNGNLLRMAERRGALTEYATRGAEEARISQSDLFGLENAFKSSYGKMQALLDPAVFALKRGQETALRKFASGKPALRKDVGAAWDDVASAQVAWRTIENRYRYTEGAGGFATRYFGIARTLLRGAQERAKPDTERLREFTEARQASLLQGLFSPAPIYPQYEEWKLAISLTKMREWLGADDAMVRQVLGRDSPETLARRMVAETKLGDVAVRKALWEGGADTLAKSNDPFIALARSIDAESRALRKRYEDEIEALESKGAERIAKARFAKFGTGVYPDATSTLRLSYGEVTGWQHAGQTAPAFTYIGDTFKRHTGEQPFALPPSWLKAQGQLDAKMPFNFVSTNDIVGGNSGSPVINRKAEVVGLVFDGNIHSLGGKFWFDDRVNRAVSVHSGAILHTLSKVYGADALVQEITAR